MKKLFILLLMSVFLITIVSAGACTESGFDYCSQSSNSFGNANANAKVFWSFEDDNGRIGTSGGGVSLTAVGNLYINADMEGDEGHVFFNVPSWNSIWNSVMCEANGLFCDMPRGNVGDSGDYKFFTQGNRNKVATIGQTFNKCVAVTALDHNRASNGDWAWTGTGYGWISNCPNIKVVECKSDSDCFSGKECSNNVCEEPFVCSNGELECNGLDSNECNNNQFVPKGKVINQCGVECLSGKY